MTMSHFSSERLRVIGYCKNVYAKTLSSNLSEHLKEYALRKLASYIGDLEHEPTDNATALGVYKRVHKPIVDGFDRDADKAGRA